MEKPLQTAPLVSIVLPTFNRADLLPNSIDSVLRQTYKNLELIIVDDHSSDETQSVVEAFDDDRISYVRNQANLKLPCSLNKGFSLSNGAYLSWTSDDNLYTENAIQRMVEFMQSRNCDFVFADYFNFSSLDLTTGNPQDSSHVKLPNTLQLQKANQIGGCFLYTRAVYEAVGDYDPDLFLIEDYDYFIRISKLFEMCHISEPLYYLRRHDRSLFCSRFSEVKASDLLVRYKNNLINKNELIEATVDLILANRNMLRNLFLRGSFKATNKMSYRFGMLYKNIYSKYLRKVLKQNLIEILEAYDSEAITFKTGKDRLSEILQGHLKLEYSKQ